MKQILATFILSMMVCFVRGNQNMEISNQMNIIIKANKEFDSLRKQHAKSCRIEIAFLKRKEIDNLFNKIFLNSDLPKASGEESLFCVVRISSDNNNSFEYIPHSSLFKVLDEDLNSCGLNEIKVGVRNKKDVFYSIYSLNCVDSKIRDKLLNKKEIIILFDKLYPY